MPRVTRPPPTSPIGFILLAVLALCSVFMAGGLLEIDDPGGWAIGVWLLYVCVAFLAFEALLFAKPWAARPTGLLGASMIVLLARYGIVNRDMDALAVAFVLTGVVPALVLYVRAALRSRAALLRAHASAAGGARP